MPSPTLVRYAATRDRPAEPALSPQEARALDVLRAEAAAHGVTLKTNGVGGLPPSLVLGVMRRDGYRCHRCGRTDHPLDVHHKGDLMHPASRWLAAHGKANTLPNLVTVCAQCHDAIHAEDRAKGGPTAGAGY